MLYEHDGHSFGAKLTRTLSETDSEPQGGDYLSAEG